MKTPILEVLEKLLPDESKTSLRDLIKQKRVLSDGFILEHDALIQENQEVAVVPKKIFRDGYTIYYEDRHILVIEKPEGLLSVSTEKETYHTLHSKTKMWHKKVWPVQRLDRETSGVMVFALSEKAKEGLKTQFIHHTIYREYFAKVEGFLEGFGTWRHPLYEDKNFFVHIGQEGDEVAVTHYEVLYHKNNETAVKFVLETGKKNQIRVQASHEGFPIVGDKKYGNSQKSAKRLMLHAHKLTFTHPIMKKNLSFISPKPFR